MVFRPNAFPQPSPHESAEPALPNAERDLEVALTGFEKEIEKRGGEFLPGDAVEAPADIMDFEPDFEIPLEPAHNYDQPGLKNVLDDIERRRNHG